MSWFQKSISVLVFGHVICMGFNPQTPGSVPAARLLLHCRPPVSVVGKPIVAHFSVKLGPGGEFAAVFERDSAGNSRIELRDPVNKAPLFAQLWASKEKTDKLVFYQERSIVIRKWPSSPAWDAWSFGPFDGQWTDEHQKFVSQDSRKVILKMREGGSPPHDVGECWISEPLAIVMRERVLDHEGNAQEWQITELQSKAPSRDVLAVPADFQVIGPPQEQ